MRVFAVDSHLLVRVVWVSLVFGVAISTLFSLVIVGAVRAGDARRAGHAVAAAGYAAFGVLAFALFAVGVVLGVQAMVAK
jgi:hypothetical protein